MPLHFVLSQKNKKNLLEDGFTYSVNRVAEEKVIWRCTAYYSSKCPGRCHTSSMATDGTILKVTEHNHPPELAAAQAKSVMSEVREQAKSSTRTTSKVIASVSKDVPVAVAGKLPSISCMSRTIRRLRHEAKNMPPVAKTIADSVIPDEYKATAKNETFLLCDSRTLDSNCSDTFLIFSTDANLNVLSNCNNWFSDGTFRTVPGIFHQLYSIHGTVRDHVVPLVYVLMTGKSSKTYKAVLRQLCTLEPRLSPDVIMCDFESAYIKAVSTVFPHASVKGCYFHFSQCIWRGIQSSALQQQYGNDTEYELNLKMLYAIAFVPEHDVVFAFEELIKTVFYVHNKNELAPLLEYYEATWIGLQLRRRGRRRPRYDIGPWNHYDSVLSDLHKTNNHVENWHRNFNASAAACHLNIWDFIQLLRSEQSKVELMLEQVFRGDGRPAKKARVESRHRRLKVAVQNYDRADMITYLRGIAHNL